MLLLTFAYYDRIKCASQHGHVMKYVILIQFLWAVSVLAQSIKLLF